MSKSEYQINSKSEILEGMHNDLNKSLSKVVREIYDENFTSGEISIKLKLNMADRFVEVIKQDSDGDRTIDNEPYRTLVIKHSVSHKLEDKDKLEGLYDEPKQIVYEDKQFKLKAVKNGQIQMEV